MKRYDWDKLNHLQIGQYGEYFAKMELTMFGFDVYTSEVDDKGIDFIIRKDANTYYDIQVKTVRNNNYIYIHKHKLDLRDNLFIIINLLEIGQPVKSYLIPSTIWNTPDKIFVSKDYKEGQTSLPEWGIQLSKKNLHLLEPYAFDKMVANL